MPELDGILRDLARLKSSSEPIVSVYLDLRWSDEKQRERVRLFVQEKARHALGHYLPESPGRLALARTLARVKEFVAGLATQAGDTDRRGIALFACEGMGLFRPHLFRRPFENELCLDAIPHLVQLARFADEYEPAIVVVPNQGGADLYQVSLGDLAVEARLRGFVPRRENDEFNPGAAKPGRQFERLQKDERHQEAFIQKNRRAAAAEATALFDRSPGSKVVLVGPSEVVAAFERELPERVRARIIAKLPRPREWDSADGIRRAGVIAGVSQAIERHEREADAGAVDALVGEALRGGVAVVGPEDVVLALNEGRIHRLVIEQDFHRAGWRCEVCGALGMTEDDERCPWCAGELHTTGDLGEALVARTLREGGEVEVVAHTNKLHSYRGIGAFLRQSGATGLRGAEPWPTAG